MSYFNSSHILPTIAINLFIEQQSLKLNNNIFTLTIFLRIYLACASVKSKFIYDL